MFCLLMNVFTFSSKNGIVENSLRILDLCRTPETDSTNPWGSIEPGLRTTGLGILLLGTVSGLVRFHDPYQLELQLL